MTAETPTPEPIEDVVARDLSGWAQFIYNCTTGDNYFRTQEHYDLIRDLDAYERDLTAARQDCARIASERACEEVRARKAEMSLDAACARVAELEKFHMLVMHETGDAGCGLMPHHPRDALLILRNAARALLSPSPEPQP